MLGLNCIMNFTQQDLGHCNKRLKKERRASGRFYTKCISSHQGKNSEREGERGREEERD